MSLFELPHVVWYSVVIIWLGDFRAIVRLDCACRHSLPSRSLVGIYTGRAFRLLNHDGDIEGQFAVIMGGSNMHVSNELILWMKSRNVYLSHLVLADGNDRLPAQYQELLSWSGNAVDCVQILANVADSSAVLWASLYLRRLRKLELTAQYNASPGVVENFLQNNANTLLALALTKRNFLRKPAVPYNFIYFPQLRVLSWSNWENGNPSEMVRGCPNHTALSVASAGGYSVAELASTIANSCPQLERLRYWDVVRISQHSLLQIAQGCPYLQYLELSGCYQSPDVAELEISAEVVCAMPRLHTLVVHVMSEETLLEIAARGHPSLRVLDTSTRYSCWRFRQITAGLPQLTGLAIRGGVCYWANCNPMHLFEFCGGLKVLKLGTGTNERYEDVAGAILESVATYCPYLRTLSFNAGFNYRHNAQLHAVLHSCPHLRTLYVGHQSGLTAPPSRPDIVVTEKEIELEEWMPEWAKFNN